MEHPPNYVDPYNRQHQGAAQGAPPPVAVVGSTSALFEAARGAPVAKPRSITPQQASGSPFDKVDTSGFEALMHGGMPSSVQRMPPPFQRAPHGSHGSVAPPPSRNVLSFGQVPVRNSGPAAPPPSSAGQAPVQAMPTKSDPIAMADEFLRKLG